MKTPCVYIMASRKNGTLYIGVTSNLAKRVNEHKNGMVDGPGGPPLRIRPRELVAGPGFQVELPCE